MSMKLFEFAVSFVEGKISADEFADSYIEKWYNEGDSGLLVLDEDALSSACSTTFLMADNYNPEADRGEEEFDEAQLRREVAEVLKTVRR